MKSNEEFIEGIYRKTEVRMEAEFRKDRKIASEKTKIRSTVRGVIVAAAVLGICMCLPGMEKITTKKEHPDAQPQVLSEFQEPKSSGQAMRSVSREEYRVEARLLRVEILPANLELEQENIEKVLLFYEALEVDGEQPKEGTEFSFTITEEEWNCYYPFGAVPGSVQVLWLLQKEEGFALTFVEQDEEFLAE